MTGRNVRQPLTDEDRATFPEGQAIRYLPGFGTYGFEDCVEDDGRLPGVVLGHTPTRVRVELTLRKRGGSKERRSVNAAQLIRAMTRVQEIARQAAYERRHRTVLQHLGFHAPATDDDIADAVAVAVLQELEAEAMRVIADADSVPEVAPLYRFVHLTLQKQLALLKEIAVP